jgi:CBS domain-containing protein
MAVMAANDLRHLPVLENDELAGVVSIGDLVQSVIGDQRFSIEQYEHYIHGDR